MKTTSNHFTAFLKDKLNYLQTNGISRIVIKDVLASNDPVNFITDVISYGCDSGIVSHLVYYVDTYAFYDTHYDEIEQLRYEYRIQVPFNQDLKNFLAWRMYEIVANKLYQEFNRGY